MKLRWRITGSNDDDRPPIKCRRVTIDHDGLELSIIANEDGFHIYNSSAINVVPVASNAIKLERRK